MMEEIDVHKLSGAIREILMAKVSPESATLIQDIKELNRKSLSLGRDALTVSLFVDAFQSAMITNIASIVLNQLSKPIKDHDSLEVFDEEEGICLRRAVEVVKEMQPTIEANLCMVVSSYFDSHRSVVVLAEAEKRHGNA